MILAGRELGAGPPLVLLHGLFGSAGNFGLVQRRLAARFRVIALDLRNHGDSPHAAAMGYAAMAADVRETLRARDALPARLVGHSMGGKVAMQAALAEPDAVAALVVVDIAPVQYPPGFRAYADAMSRLPLRPGLTRAEADAALAPAVPDAGVRGFLLQNLRLGGTPSWRIGLAGIAAAPAGNRGLGRARRAVRRTDALHGGRGIGLHKAGASRAHPRPVPGGPLRHGEIGGTLGACREPRRVPRRAGGIPAVRIAPCFFTCAGNGFFPRSVRKERTWPGRFAEASR